MARLRGDRPARRRARRGPRAVDTEGPPLPRRRSPSLWVSTLGHRVPELDEALRDQLDRVAHSTMLGQRERRDDRARRGAGAARAGRRSALPLRERRRRGGRAGDPRSRSSTGPTEACPERRAFLALEDAYHGDTFGALSLGDDGGFGGELFDPLRFPVLRAPGLRDGGLGRRSGRPRRASTPPSSRAVVIEPLVQGAAGHAHRRPRRRPPPRRGLPRARRPARLRRGRDRLRPHRRALRVGALRDPAGHPRPRQRPDGRLPRDVGHGRVAGGSPTPSSAPTSAPRRSTTATPSAATRSPPPSRVATSSCSRSGTSSRACARASPSCALLARARARPAPRRPRDPRSAACSPQSSWTRPTIRSSPAASTAATVERRRPRPPDRRVHPRSSRRSRSTTVRARAHRRRRSAPRSSRPLPWRA